MRRILLVLLLTSAGCGRDEPPPPPQPEAARKSAVAEPQAPSAPASAEQRREGEGAAAVLRRYYDHLEAGRYREAWEMRGGDEAGLEHFARNFAAYQRYQVTLGHPTQPVESGGWTYVEVPIQILGTLKGGKGFGSVGSVTMRRAAGGTTPATRRERDWHIHTG